MTWSHFILGINAFIFLTGFGSCGSSHEDETASASDTCAPVSLSGSPRSGNAGVAQVFSIDPMTSSGNFQLTPRSGSLDHYRVQVPLENLSGYGILKGKYIEVGNGLNCGGQFGAFESRNQFSYSHQDDRFQESMVYFYGDQYQQAMDQAGYLVNRNSVRIIAHCDLEDNAFFSRKKQLDGSMDELVCLGDSVMSRGAYYSDDAVVTLHELQHGATSDNYSLNHDLNQFWYDEAGALNEAVSDFMSLMFTEVYSPPGSSMDPRTFSRWALGTFDPAESHLRGAHFCPMYDSRFPNCDAYPQFYSPTNENGNNLAISYVYPDGLGWPYPNNHKGANLVQTIFSQFKNQEEIHNTGMIILGALWDAYSSVKQNHPGTEAVIRKAMTQVLMESIRHLPAPNTRTNHSPVTFIGLAANIMSYSNQISDLSDADRVSLGQAFKKRGLYEFPALASSSWLKVGEGTNSRIPTTSTPGVYVLDDPLVLRNWLLRMGANSGLIKADLANSGNSQLDPGEVAALWFDLENQSDITAGGVLVTATSTTPHLVFLDESTNIGYMTLSGSNQAQIMYGKVNGKQIVSAFNPAGGAPLIPIGNTYFRTNPFFNKSWRTALWVKVSPDAAHGEVIKLQVQATPANGVPSTQEFSVTIH